MMLAEGDQWDPRSWVWIGVGDIGPLFEEFRSGVVNARLPPADYPWAHEIQIQDSEGNILRFDSEPMKGAP
jgi:hypothetical protein